MGSTQLEASAALEQPAAHYPVDDLTEKTDCELHMLMKNISFKVAVSLRYQMNLEQATILVRFQLAMLMSGWIKLYRDLRHLSLTILEVTMRRHWDKPGMV